MAQRVDYSRKQLSVWSDTANLIKALSKRLDVTQVELLHRAVVELAERVKRDDDRGDPWNMPT